MLVLYRGSAVLKGYYASAGYRYWAMHLYLAHGFAVTTSVLQIQLYEDISHLYVTANSYENDHMRIIT